jgi:hypothetical protein
VDTEHGFRGNLKAILRGFRRGGFGGRDAAVGGVEDVAVAEPAEASGEDRGEFVSAFVGGSSRRGRVRWSRGHLRFGVVPTAAYAARPACCLAGEQASTEELSNPRPK